jgi:hypothetical protein
MHSFLVGATRLPDTSPTGSAHYLIRCQSRRLIPKRCGRSLPLLTRFTRTSFSFISSMSWQPLPTATTPAFIDLRHPSPDCSGISKAPTPNQHEKVQPRPCLSSTTSLELYWKHSREQSFRPKVTRPSLSRTPPCTVFTSDTIGSIRRTSSDLSGLKTILLVSLSNRLPTPSKAMDSRALRSSNRRPPELRRSTDLLAPRSPVRKQLTPPHSPLPNTSIISDN